MTTAVVGRGLTKRYGERVAVDGVDFDIASGECFGFLGPNGAGKTTTMRMLCCLTSRDGGNLEVLGLDPDRDARPLKARIGVVSQDTTLDVELSVRENLLVFANYFGLRGEAAASITRELMDLVGLADRADSAVTQLSGGMQRRLQIARALVNSPEVVFLDEPTTGLDPQARHVVWERLRQLKRRGVTLVLTTHYMDEAERLCDRLVIMDHGRVIRAGTPASLIAETVGTEVLEVELDAAALERLGRMRPDLDPIDVGDGVWQFGGGDAEALHEQLRDTGIDCSLRAARRAGLEDVFLRLTGRQLRDGG
ncbi:MAG: ABC transporter ATP-binding protein [Thermoleophilia bacterium]